MQAPPAGVLCSFFSKHLRKALLQLVSDPVEKCRETAIAIMDAFTARALLPPQELVVLTAELVPLARSRVGVAPFAEPTEEIRLQLMQVRTMAVRRERPARPAYAAAEVSADRCSASSSCVPRGAAAELAAGEPGRVAGGGGAEAHG